MSIQEKRMPHAYSSISFTDSVKNSQSRYGSREANQRFEKMDDVGYELGAREADFIEQRDSFYQASVSETGWPYVQHRGGPIGFVKVLDSKTIGYADFRGNRQYISVGNLQSDNRVSMIFMDYAHRQRLKLYGRVKIVDESEASELVAKLTVPEYRARVERGMIITVEAWDWNCPQHITPRFTEVEIAALEMPVNFSAS
jgi:uncharacterized protein